MALRIQDWLTDLLGFQPATQFVQLETHYADAVVCSPFLDRPPTGFEGVSLAVVRDNLAVLPVDWINSGIINPWYSIDSHVSLTECMTTLQEASFIAFHEHFLDLVGVRGKLGRIHQFSGDDAQHVHEAPVYTSTTNELIFADTSVIGWLWALEVDTYQIRKINTSPPLENVNGATMRDSRIYLTTNGGRAPGIWNCSLPANPLKDHETNIEPPHPIEDETINCIPVVNNYRLTHLNSPNDLIFTSAAHILFTDPTYGWAQSWPGIGPPELPTTTYHFNTHTRALTPLDNNQILQPNGLALSADEKTLFVADSNSTSGKPIGVWEDSVRNVYAFDFDEATLSLRNRRLVHVVESGWPDGLRVTSMKSGDGHTKELVLVATMGGVDVVDVSKGGAGVLLGKFNVGDDIVFNLEPIVKGGGWRSGDPADMWLFTGRKAVYRLDLSPIY